MEGGISREGCVFVCVCVGGGSSEWKERASAHESENFKGGFKRVPASLCSQVSPRTDKLF